MTQIIPRASIRAKARRDFDAGLQRDEHGFNPGASAIFDYLEEFDRCASQVTHFTPTGRQRVDQAQFSATYQQTQGA